MFGFIMSALAGALMSIQGVFNTRLNEKVDIYTLSAFVQGSGFLISVILMLFLGKSGIKPFTEVNKLYLTGGIIGIFITVLVVFGIKSLNPTVATGAILITQLLVASLIDAFGLFGTEKIPFTWTNYLGIFLMIAGVVTFKFNH